MGKQVDAKITIALAASYKRHPFLYYWYTSARLAQSVEHETLNLGVVGSSPTLGG